MTVNEEKTTAEPSNLAAVVVGILTLLALWLILWAAEAAFLYVNPKAGLPHFPDLPPSRGDWVASPDIRDGIVQ